MTDLLLDTCALIWSAEGEGLARDAETAMSMAYEGGRPVGVSPISGWEIGLLAARGRLRSSLHPLAWFRRAAGSAGTRMVDLSVDILVASSFLPGDPPRDPVDRILIATARDLGLTLVTRDRAILRYAGEGHVGALPC